MNCKTMAALAAQLLTTLVLAANSQVYKITDLGRTNDLTALVGMNNSGNVVGSFCLDGLLCHPFLWKATTGMKDIGTLPGGGIFAYAAAVNDLIQVVGASDFLQSSGGQTHAFLWTATGGMEDLGNLGCPNLTGANGINLFGQVVGTSTVEPCPGGGQDRAFLWTQHSGMQNLGTLPGGTFSVGNGINVLGQAVGYSDCSSCAGHHAFFWNAGDMKDLGVLPGGVLSDAQCVNDVGWVVGNADPAQSGGMIHAVLWMGSSIRDLGTLPGGLWSAAYAVNDFGQVVGSSDSAASATHTFKWGPRGVAIGGGSHAFIWSPEKGMRDLNDLIIPARSGWLLINATAINIFGQIAGTGNINGKIHAYLLTPRGRALHKLKGLD